MSADHYYVPTWLVVIWFACMVAAGFGAGVLASAFLGVSLWFGGIIGAVVVTAILLITTR